jgi:hypothetical protein
MDCALRIGGISLRINSLAGCERDGAEFSTKGDHR